MEDKTNDVSTVSENTPHHVGFYGGIENDLREYKNELTFDREHPITKESIVMDMLIVKKNDGVEIKNEIGKIFRKYNVIEYKAYNDELNIDSFFKALRAYTGKVNAIKADEMTVSLFRNGYPREMFLELKRIGADIIKDSDGIYRVEGYIHMPIQVVVIRELRKGTHTALKILAPNADEEDIRVFLEDAKQLTDKDDKNNVRAILKISARENSALFQKIWEEEEMKDVLDEIMHVEERMEERAEERVEDSQKQTARDMILDNEPLSKIAKYSRLSVESIRRLAETMGMSIMQG